MYNKPMVKKTAGYEINEKDIDSVLKFLKATDPEHATPEMAIEVLEALHAGVHTMAHNDPEKLKAIYEGLIKQKKLRTN